jgi:hypothetical protein
MERKELVYTLDIPTYFPHYEELEKLHSKIITGHAYVGVGPCGVFNDIIDWVMRGIATVEREDMTYDWEFVIPGNWLRMPDGFERRKGKRAARYEKLFIDTALVLWKALPKGVNAVFPVQFKRNKAIFIVVYTADKWEQYEIVNRLRAEAFYTRDQRTGALAGRALRATSPE